MSSSSGLRRLLLPLTPLYQFGLARRERRLATGREPIRRLRFPVISIGNLSTGGAGKTPLTIALAQALTRRGFAVDGLSRGYSRRSKQAARVDPAGTAEEFGDEPLLIARQAGVPVYVAPQRYDAGVLAERAEGHGQVSGEVRLVHTSGAKALINSAGATPGINPRPAAPTDLTAACDAGVLAESEFLYPAEAAPAPPQVVHILDDGFQHRQLHRDIDILLLNQVDWHDRLLPAGNLREALRAAARASVIAIPATEPELEAELRGWGWNGPIWRLHRRMESRAIDAPVFAFCGLARPEQFFAGLETAGLDVSGSYAFPDHHTYTARDLDRLAAQASAVGATTLLTTEKDEVRLAGLRTSLAIATVHLRTEIEDEPAALDWVTDRLKLISWGS
jgi:tetraacyldisaccharide 4'-kinase